MDEMLNLNIKTLILSRDGICIIFFKNKKSWGFY
jgi:hypothetical protein